MADGDAADGGQGAVPAPAEGYLDQILEMKPLLPSCSEMAAWRQQPLDGAEACALRVIDALADAQRLALGNAPNDTEKAWSTAPRKAAAAAVQCLAAHVVMLAESLQQVRPALTRVVADRDGIAKATVLGQRFASTVEGVLHLGATIALNALTSMFCGKVLQSERDVPDTFVEIERNYIRIWTRPGLKPEDRAAAEAIALPWLSAQMTDYVGADRTFWNDLRQLVTAEVALVRDDEATRRTAQLATPAIQLSQGAAAPNVSVPSSVLERGVYSKKTGRLNPAPRELLLALPAKGIEEAGIKAKINPSTARDLSQPLQTEGLMRKVRSKWVRTEKADKLLAAEAGD